MKTVRFSRSSENVQFVESITKIDLRRRKPAALARLIAPDDPVLQLKLVEAREALTLGEKPIALVALPYVKQLVNEELPWIERTRRENGMMKRLWKGNSVDRKKVLDWLTRDADFYNYSERELVSFLVTATKEEARVIVNHILDTVALNKRYEDPMNVIGYAYEHANHEIKDAIQEVLVENGFAGYHRRIKEAPAVCYPLFGAGMLVQVVGLSWATFIVGTTIELASISALSILRKLPWSSHLYNYEFLTTKSVLEPTHTSTTEPATVEA